MHFLASLTTLLAFGATIASAAPHAPREDGVLTAPETDILQKCKDAGIDVYGPIPDDYLDYDVELQRYHFGSDSKAALWTVAQGYIEEPTSQHEKRQGWANIGIGMWAQDNCQGEGYWWDNVEYNVHHVAYINLFSYLIRYRGLRSNERLDFSRLRGSDWCGQYAQSAPGSAGAGCRNVNTQPINCFRLWLR